jgi:hypothetical protein
MHTDSGWEETFKVTAKKIPRMSFKFTQEVPSKGARDLMNFHQHQHYVLLLPPLFLRRLHLH